jgi:transcriptional regulator with XRE-family HTH domain
MEQSIQDRFFQKIKQILPANYALADELADVLNLSKDSVYRRLRGETSLSLEEVLTICQHYKITFESIANPNAVTFEFKEINPDVESFQQYLIRLLGDLKRIKSLENSEILYAAEDIPVFHHFNHPLLTSFKLFYWMRSVMNVKELEGQRFNPKHLPQEMVDLAKEIYRTYLEIPGVEIWTEETLSSTLKQIEYYWEAGLFESKEMAVLVCEDFIMELHEIQRLCEKGSKSNVAFRFYINDIMIGNNCILIKAGGNKYTYLSHHSFNFMLTTDYNFSNQTEIWLDGMMQKSMLISSVSEKYRNKFFLRQISRIEQLKLQMLQS